jgi:hypothetical protein
VLAAALVACVVGVFGYVASRPRDQNLAAAPVLRPRIRGPIGYPALPPLPAVQVRRGRPRGATAVAPAPPSTEQEWARTKELLDLPLRKIAADTSVLELSYRPFAEACVDSAGHSSSFARDPARDSDWLASLKTAALRSGVTLREKGAAVDCETARKGLIARADALKSDLDASEEVAQANGVLPAHWRRLLLTHELEVWDRY